ncbi:MAG: DUF6265 family protein [Cyclobacteriaceae bacterium]
MKSISLLIFLLVAASLSGQSKKAEKLMWLEGRWDRTDIKGTAQAFEIWETGVNDEMTGIGVMLDDKDTVFVERLTISRRRGNLYYIAEVAANAEPTYFKITSIGNNSFVCENEAHDFPKMISYSLDSDILTVVISGNSRSRKFIFKKED